MQAISSGGLPAQRLLLYSDRRTGERPPFIDPNASSSLSPRYTNGQREETRSVDRVVALLASRRGIVHHRDVERVSRTAWAVSSTLTSSVEKKLPGPIAK